MEGAKEDGAAPLAGGARDAMLHLRRRFFGEGQADDGFAGQFADPIQADAGCAR